MLCAALVLISWFLMLPPPVMPPVKDASGDYKMNTAAPMSQWLKFKTLKSEEACKAQLKKVQPFYKCVSERRPRAEGRRPSRGQRPEHLDTLRRRRGTQCNKRDAL